MTTKTKTYVVATGMDHPKGRNEPGETYTGPVKSLPWLIEQGHVVESDSQEAAALVAQLADNDESAEA